MYILGNMLIEIIIMLKNISGETFINLINYHYISDYVVADKAAQVKMKQAIMAQMA